MFRQSYQLKLALIAMLSVSCEQMLCEIAFAQEEATINNSSETAEQPHRSPSNALTSGTSESKEAQPRESIEQEAEKENIRKSALAGLLVLSLICIVFLVLIILVALWARRIRMLTRRPLPEQHPGDPLWYLRKGTGSDSSSIAELTEGGSAQDDS